MKTLCRVIGLLAVAAVVSGCAAVSGVKLAVQGKTDEALAVLEKAEKGSGFTAIFAALEREAVLREAGRMDEADALRKKRESRPGMTEKEKADDQKAIQETVENIRKEREKRGTTSPN